MLMSRKRISNKVYENKGEPIFQAVLSLVFVLASLSFIYPYWHVLVKSFSPPAYAQMSGIKLWPKVFSTDAYTRMFNTTFLWTGYLNTIKVCAMGWALSLFFTVLGAYPLSKRDLPMRGLFSALIVITMFVSGGMIPGYLLVNNVLRMRNMHLALVLPHCISTYYLIIMRNYFMSLPLELEEAATIDGANSFKVLWQIMLPLSTPILATISLWVLVFNWNAYFYCMLYITDSSKFVLQFVLRRIIQSDSKEMTGVSDALTNSTDADVYTLRSASIILATLPIICVYPFIQKYFVKGMLLGSVKG